MDNKAEHSISHSLATQVIKVFSAVEASSEAVFVANTKGHIEYANKRFLDINGLTEEEVLGSSISKIPHSNNIALKLMELIDGIDRGELREQIVEVSRGGNLLSNSFISLAGAGYLFEGFKNLLTSLIEGDKSSVRARTKNLLSLGASSGSDMGVGFLLTINFFAFGKKISDSVFIGV